MDLRSPRPARNPYHTIITFTLERGFLYTVHLPKHRDNKHWFAYSQYLRKRHKIGLMKDIPTFERWCPEPPPVVLAFRPQPLSAQRKCNLLRGPHDFACRSLFGRGGLTKLLLQQSKNYFLTPGYFFVTSCCEKVQRAPDCPVCRLSKP